MKSGWKKGVYEWRNINPNCAITKKDFAPILKNVLTKTVRKEILINGFRACGLYPWNPNQINFKKFLGKNKFAELNDLTNSNIIESTTYNGVLNNQLNFKDFSNIVGEEMVTKFKNIQNVVETENYSDEFFTLYRLYEKLKNNDDNVNFEVEKNTSQSALLPENETYNQNEFLEKSSNISETLVQCTNI